MNELLEKIRSRGHWKVTIRPTSFAVRRIESLVKLEAIFREAHVELRGWDYPYLSRDGPSRHSDFLQDSVSWDTHYELWRLYQSGQFYHEFGMREDWWLESGFGGPKVEPGAVLSLTSTLYSVTEIFRFAARLTEAAALGPEMIVAYRLVGLASRQLQTFDSNRTSLSDGRKASPDLHDFGESLRMPSEDLIARANDVAVEQTLAIYERFRWEPARETLVEEQRKFLERRF